ncbi:bifunctional phosphatase IMPL2, chloroplastic isoform X2 [Humulus lupulus]|uniref:bifunctional phosphatase IMPL2, chloroplastic isoform X2 n=1 Tax=Humulus lupulus TaxID=3486 RepID=UPI002B407CBE|nr:bifunctional phosphatase IMPL2, chloroplastic isoform X2 [Humulus lupulus]
MLSQCFSQTATTARYFPSSSFPPSIPISRASALNFTDIRGGCHSLSLTCRPNISMACNSKLSNGIESLSQGLNVDRIAEVANEAADASGVVLRKYFRSKFEILDKEDLSPVTIADQTAEESMWSCNCSYGEEKGWRCKEKDSEYVWVLDPIDGTKSFITGKPVFGTLIALLHKGKPILGIIDQPVLRERWIGMSGRKTILNGEEVSTRSCANISQAYMYTTSPHLFNEEAKEAFVRVRDKVKVPLYGCDCYAYALLSSGHVDLVVESGLQPYDILALIPVIEGAGGVITGWKGEELSWEASPNSHATKFNVVAAGDKQIHQQALELLQWQ